MFRIEWMALFLCAGCSSMSFETKLKYKETAAHVKLGIGEDIAEIADPTREGDMVRIVWIGADGSEIGEDTLDLPHGGFQLQVPQGAVRIEGTIVSTSDSGNAPGLRWAFPGRTDSALKWSLPIVWDDRPALEWSFEIDDAHTFEEVDELVDPIVALGPGASVPAGVSVAYWRQTELEPDGLHIVSASPESWSIYDVTVRDVWMATLNDASLSNAGSWELLELVVPLDVLDLSQDPGEHSCWAHWASQTTGMLEAAETSLAVTWEF